MVRWLWAHQFSAVAGDAPSFERAPIRGAHADPNFNLHEWVLAGWGTPIGEMFDLEKLSEHCKASGRYSFFLSSMPLKVGFPLIDCAGIVLIQTRSRSSGVSLARLMRLLFSKFILSTKMRNNLRDPPLQSAHRNAGGIVPPSVPPGGEGQHLK